MSTETTKRSEFRAALAATKAPKVVADCVAGMLLGCAEVLASPERVFRALMTSEVERWWTIPSVYRLKDWQADLRTQGRWSVTVALPDGRQFNEWGEICEVNAPHKIVMTRRFAANPLIGERETTLTYRFEPSAHGTLVTVREEGFIGRPDAAHGNAENWEKVLGWLDGYLTKEYEQEKQTTAKVIFGNHSSVLVPHQDRESVRRFYCDVLGGKITKAEDERDFLRVGENFYIAFLYGDVPDESEFFRTARSVWLEIKSDNVDVMRRKILESGLVKKLDIPDPHLYFQAPGGQCLRLVGIDEDMSFYEGAGAGPDVTKVKEAMRMAQMKN